jgi:hypothetical protein
MSATISAPSLTTPEPIKDWSLTSLRESARRSSAHGRYVAFQMAEDAIPRNLFASILADR